MDNKNTGMSRPCQTARSTEIVFVRAKQSIARWLAPLALLCVLGAFLTPQSAHAQVTFTPTTMSNGELATPYSVTFSASGGTAPYSYSLAAGGMPPGMSLSSTGVFSGTPSLAGTYNFTVRVTDAASATTTNAYSVTMSAPVITIDTPAGALPGATAYVPYSFTFSASGGAGPRHFSLVSGSMPPGMALSSAGLFSGTPVLTGTYTFTMRATDSSGAPGPFNSAPVTFSVTVAAPVVTFAPATLPDGRAGTPYSASFTASGGTAPHSFSLVSGAMPIGISFSSAGVFAGTPASTGTYNIRVRATDHNGFSADRDYTLVILAPTITFTPNSLASSQPGVAYPTVTFTASGGASPYTFSLPSGALPPGMSLSSAGVFSGTPSIEGTFNFAVRATDNNGFNVTQNYSLIIAIAPPPTAVADSVSAVSMQPIAIPVTANDSGSITSIAVASAPAHGSVSVAGLVATYTSAAGYSGSDSFTYTATGPGGTSAPATVSLTVNPLPAPSAPITRTVLAGQSVRVDLTSAASGGPFVSAAIVSVAPAAAGNATIIDSGSGAARRFDLELKLAATFNGTAVVTYTLANAYATSAPGTVTVTVEPRPDPSQDPGVRGLIAAQNEAARRFGIAQLANINGRLQSQHNGGRGNANRIAFVDADGELRNDVDTRSLQKIRLASNGGDDEAIAKLAPRANETETGATPGAWSMWAAGSVNFGTRDGSAARSGVRFTTDGLTIGMDRRSGERFLIGGALGYGHDSSRMRDTDTKSTADGYSLALYSSVQPGEHVFIDAIVGYNSLSFDTRRRVDTADAYALGSRDGSQFIASVSTAIHWHWSELDLLPYGRFDITDTKLDAYSESGAGPYALAFERQSLGTVTGSLGVRADYRYRARFGELVPRARIELNNDFKDSAHADLHYADWTGGPSYRVEVDSIDRQRALIGAGLDLLIKSTRIGLDYERTLASDGDIDSLRLMFQMSF